MSMMRVGVGFCLWIRWSVVLVVRLFFVFVLLIVYLWGVLFDVDV